MFELQNDRFQTYHFGDRQRVSHALKHEVADGRYRIIGPGWQLYCVRIKGQVYPDPDHVQLKRHTNPQGPALQYTPIT